MTDEDEHGPRKLQVYRVVHRPKCSEEFFEEYWGVANAKEITDHTPEVKEIEYLFDCILFGNHAPARLEKVKPEEVAT